MKHIFVSAIVALTLATNPLSAATPVELHEIQGYAPSEDLSQLSNRQVQMLLHIIHGTDREGKKYQQVRGFLLRVNGGSLLQTLFR